MSDACRDGLEEGIIGMYDFVYFGEILRESTNLSVRSQLESNLGELAVTIEINRDRAILMVYNLLGKLAERERRHAVDSDQTIAREHTGFLGQRTGYEILDNEWYADSHKPFGLLLVDALVELARHLDIHQSGRIAHLTEYGDSLGIVEEQRSLCLLEIILVLTIDGIDNIAILEPFIKQNLMIIIS